MLLRKLKSTLLALAVLAAMLLDAQAYQQGQATRYIYDENGRLHVVVTPAGEAAVYEYDPAGNITAIRRLDANAFELFSFAPSSGVPGDHVTIYGVGLSSGVNSVSFNGVNAQIVESNSVKLVVTVPTGATTGPITVAGTRGTITTSKPFTVRGINVFPASSRLLEGDELQFSAVVAANSGNQNVNWSVNGVAGGNTTVGTITAAGLYTAPAQLNSAATVANVVRATSQADPTLVKEAQVTVINLGSVRIPTAAGVSVAVGLPTVSSLIPSILTRNTPTAITINGTNLTGATALRFFRLFGEWNQNITVTNLTVNAAGTVLTATVTANNNAAGGQHFAVVLTPSLASLSFSTGVNTLTVQ